MNGATAPADLDIAKFSRTATNPLTWLRAQLESAKYISPITRTHIRRMFARLGKKNGRIDLIPDEDAELQAAQIAHRLNWMRAQEHLLSMQVTDKGYLNTQKAMQIAVAGIKKVNDAKDKQAKGRNGAQNGGASALWQKNTKEHVPTER